VAPAHFLVALWIEPPAKWTLFHSVPLCFLLLSHAAIHFSRFPLTPRAFNFFFSRSCGTVSKRFCEVQVYHVGHPAASSADIILSRKASKLVVQDRPHINPCCVGWMSPFLSKCLTTWSLMMLSISLQDTDVRETGL
jgi:hypothetical protein